MKPFIPLPFEIGQWIRLGSISLTVNNFDAMIAKNPDNKLMIIDVTIENEGTKVIEYDSKEFILRGRENYISYQIEPKEKLTLDKKILPAYSKIKDQVTFEIPIESYVELIYQPIWWTGEQIIVRLE
jgi:hypothetical protein